ncbi:MAG: succinate dehydrogenase, cytochrome b556 subunit [Burkholderiaceae bacterium]|jgi:succinate dehydrogenase / fumarate reductase cytochrome b subunit
MSELTKDDRPSYRNIHILQIAHYRLPAAGLISILHRISGAGLFLFLPFLLYLFRASLTSELSFATMQGLLQLWYVKLIVLALSWAYLHHFCAGIRHLFLDVHVGLTKEKARNSALAVFAISLPLTVVVGLKLFGAF